MDKLTTVKEIMVVDPTIAEPWHRVDDVRVLLLASSFSTLPYKWRDRWYLVADFHVLEYLRLDPRANGAQRMEEVIGSGIKPKLAKTVSPSVRCCELKVAQWPILVVEEQRLVGIVTAFDLL